jgi:uncharacterized protein with HEPN domain
MASAKEPLVRLQHILERIDGIASVTHGLTFEQIADSYL